jgi:hypothetical protein
MLEIQLRECLKESLMDKLIKIRLDEWMKGLLLRQEGRFRLKNGGFNHLQMEVLVEAWMTGQEIGILPFEEQWKGINGQLISRK